MSTELTPREHDDMRELLIAGTQRIRPARSNRVRISTALAIVLVAGAVGGVATAALNAGRDGARVGGEPAPGITEPSPTDTEPDPAIRDPGPSVPAPDSTEMDPGEVMPTTTTVDPPAPGTHMSLEPVPIYDNRLILGTSNSLDAQGVDTRSAQGFQSVGHIHPWIADLKNGEGQCILIRNNYTTGGWSEIVCDEDGQPASVEREVDGALLRFTIVDDGIQVYGVPG